MTERELDLNAVRVFVEVARRRSFSEASRALGMPSSTVSRKVAALEAQLGAMLVERTTRSVGLTGAGEVLLRACEGPLEGMVEAVEALQRFRSEPSGLLRVALPTAMAGYAGAEVTLAYLRRFPEVRLEVIATDEWVVPDWDRVHLALRAGWLGKEESGLIQKKLQDIEMVLGASPAYLEREGGLAAPADLARRGCVVVGASAEAARVTLIHRESGEEVTLEVPVRLFTTSLSLCKRVALAGVGVAGLPEVSCREALAEGRFVPVLEGWRLASPPLVALYPGDRSPPLRVRGFLDILAGRLGS